MSVPQELFDRREELIRESLQYWFSGEASVKHEVAGSINRKLRALDEEWERKDDSPEPPPCVVPQGMLEAAMQGGWPEPTAEMILRRGLAWLAANPIVSTTVLAPKPEIPPASDSLVGFIMRHFDDITIDKQALRNRAVSALQDYNHELDRGKLK